MLSCGIEKFYKKRLKRFRKEKERLKISLFYFIIWILPNQGVSTSFPAKLAIIINSFVIVVKQITIMPKIILIIKAKCNHVFVLVMKCPTHINPAPRMSIILINSPSFAWKRT